MAMTVEANTPNGAQGRLSELVDLSQDAEQGLLNRILREGLDQGCFVRVAPEDLVGESSEAVEGLLGEVGRREQCHSTDKDPFETEPVPEATIDGEDDGYIIVSQRCDLIQGLSLEPFVELVAARHTRDGDLVAAAKANSPRFVHLADTDDGAWIADLRHRSYLPKHKVVEHAPAILPITPGDARRDLALRLGQRYSRDVVPDDIVEGIQRPFANFVRTSISRRKQAALFSDFLAYRQGDGIVLLGVIGLGEDRREGDDAFRDLVGKFRSKAGMPIAPESTAITVDDLSLGLWLRGYKLDLDRISRGSKSKGNASPTR